MVIISDKVKKPVDNNSVEFILEFSIVEKSIFPDRVHADEQISGKNILLTIVERNDVSEVIMLKILHIDIEDIGIGTEYDVYSTQFLHFTLCNKLKPGIVQPPMVELEIHILKIIRNHIIEICRKSTKKGRRKGNRKKKFDLKKNYL